MTQETAIDWLKLCISRESEISIQGIKSLLQIAKRIEERQMNEKQLEGYKQGWREANAEVQKIVLEILKTHSSLVNQDHL